jgi:sugar lactone lactonase YvrE
MHCISGGITIDKHGTIYVADSANNAIRRLADGVVSTLCGSNDGKTGFADGTGAAATFNYPRGLAVDTYGNVMVADYSNNCIRKATPEGRVTTVAGSAGRGGFWDGEGVMACFYYPSDVAVDGTNNILVADGVNHRVRRIATDARVTTLAGRQRRHHAGGRVCADGRGLSATFNQPWALALDQRGRLLVAENDNAGTLRMVRTDMPWEFARILYIGLLKSHAPAAGEGDRGGQPCVFSRLPVEDQKGRVSPILNRIINMTSILQPFAWC